MPHSLLNSNVHVSLHQVDDFELAEETPVKAHCHSRARTPVSPSPEPSGPQAPPPRPPASAERRTAEWVTALSPVLEHDEGHTSHSPAGAVETQALEASPAGTGKQAADLVLFRPCPNYYPANL